MRIIRIEGSELESLLKELAERAKRDEVYSLRVSVREDGAMFKVNGGPWSPTFGTPE